MNEEKAIDLINRYKEGTLTPEEKQRLNEWYLITATESREEITAEQMEQTVELIRSNLPLPKPIRTLQLWQQIIAVAAAAVFIVSGIYFFRYQRPDASQKLSSNIDAAPGKAGATLTLNNGKRIRLSEAVNGKIASEAGITVTKTADGQIIYETVPGPVIKESPNAINTLNTANGETYMLILPDKSKIWMNSASSISYPVSFANRRIRRVKIEGEAYFEIAKDKAHPFIVESKGQRVEVLGTHFNINSYVNEPVTTTTLLEGSVKVTTGKNSKIIKPGQQTLTKGTSISVVSADIDHVTDWKDGDFNLNHVDFKTAMRKIARWYNVEVIYDPSFPNDIETGGWISRNNKLSAVIKLIESSGQAHFKIEGKKVYVSK